MNGSFVFTKKERNLNHVFILEMYIRNDVGTTVRVFSCVYTFVLPKS